MKQSPKLITVALVPVNDGEFSESVQRAIAAHCLLTSASYTTGATVARHYVRLLGKSARTLDAHAWFGLIRDHKPRHLRLVKGGGQ